MPEDQAKKLDEQDKLLRRTARKTGHTHVIAIAPATTVEGKRIGHVSY
jgi:hypothetical protein